MNCDRSRIFRNNSEGSAQLTGLLYESLCCRTGCEEEKQDSEGGEEETEAEEDQIKVGPKWEEEKSVLGTFCFLAAQFFPSPHLSSVCIFSDIKVTRPLTALTVKVILILSVAWSSLVCMCAFPE